MLWWATGEFVSSFFLLSFVLVVSGLLVCHAAGRLRRFVTFNPPTSAVWLS